MIFNKKNIYKTVPLGYVKGELYTEIVEDNRALKTKISDLRIDNSHLEAKVETQKRELKRRSALKRDREREEVEWQRDELLDMYKDTIDERDSALGNVRRLEKELKEVSNKRKVVHIGDQRISKGELEHILKKHYGYQEVSVKDCLVLIISYKGVKE